jgi:1-phosphofructokinase family hexose kinase
VILVVALNPALDVTHRVDGVDWAGVNRPREVHSRPGGKGLNVAATLHTLGAGVRVLGLAGGVTGESVAAGLEGAGVPAEFSRIAGQTRRTFTVVDSRRGEAALFSEPGPRVAPGEYARFSVMYRESLRESAAVVLSGSLPPGLAPGTYAELTQAARAAGVPVLVDAHGDAMARAVAAGPAIAKPNLAELETLAGHSLSTPAGPDLQAIAAAAQRLRAAGAGAVVVTLGAAGLWAVTADGCWRASPPPVVAANPTGAGDAVAAALAHGVVLGRPWRERLRHAVALGTACAQAPVAGEFSPGAYRRLLPGVAVDRGGGC